MTEIPNPHASFPRMLRWAALLLVLGYAVAIDIGYIHYRLWRLADEVASLSAQRVSH